MNKTKMIRYGDKSIEIPISTKYVVFYGKVVGCWYNKTFALAEYRYNIKKHPIMIEIHKNEDPIHKGHRNWSFIDNIDCPPDLVYLNVNIQKKTYKRLRKVLNYMALDEIIESALVEYLDGI